MPLPWPESRDKAIAFSREWQDAESERAVDAAFGTTKFDADADRVAFLFELYEKFTSLLPSREKPGRKSKKPKKSVH